MILYNVNLMGMNMSRFVNLRISKMKTLKTKYFIAIPVVLFFLAAVLIYANEDGRTGRTLKSSTSGCGGCHGSTSSADVIVSISGPDTVNTGQTMQYSLSVTKPSKTGAGLDIAVRQGTLNPVSTNIHLSNSELTHNNNILMSGGTATVQFNYTASATPGTDTIWATGLATNSDGSTGGDDWNWAPSKRVVVRLPTGITNISISNEFNLSQNYPNPFNPMTNIKLELTKPMELNLKIVDVLGNEVAVLHSGKLNEGQHIFKWDAKNYSSGIYYYKADGENFSITKKMLLVK